MSTSTEQSKEAAQAAARAAAKAAALAAARAAAREKAIALAGDFKLLGPNGRLRVDAASPIQFLNYTAQGGTAPISLSFEYRAQPQAAANGGFFEVLQPPTPPMFTLPAGLQKERIFALSEAARKQLSPPVSKRISFRPPPLQNAGRDYALLTVRAKDASGMEKVLTLTVDVLAPAITPLVRFPGCFDKFEVNASGFSWLNTDLMFACCYLADRDQDLIKGTLQHYGFNPDNVKPLFNPLHGMNGFAAARDDMVLLVFRGTDPHNIYNMLTDANIQMMAATGYSSAPGAHIHRGFRDAVENDFWAGIQSFLKAHGMNGNRKKKIWVTGHSLGSAIATLVAARLDFAGEPVQGVYAFAPPSVGNKEFADDYNKRLKNRTIRVINQADGVPRALVPPGFWAVGKLWYVDSSSDHKMTQVDDLDPGMVAFFIASLVLAGVLEAPVVGSAAPAAALFTLALIYHSLEQLWVYIRTNALDNGVDNDDLPVLFSLYGV